MDDEWIGKKKYGHEKFYEPSPVHFMPWQIFFFLMLTMIIKIKNIITNNLFIFNFQMLGWVTQKYASWVKDKHSIIRYRITQLFVDTTQI